ncbi:DUF3794 domain-containing protein [Oceanobacillus massiliensis]|uniref:DUF3794 domain-containing protein n=1 Tax=Oceanobacillus massiliensis TaxID=1465765 RepID=UPI0002880169|nr:DUF3794 domain-containing protein [Oceanobacillus massiliensis]
MKKKVDEMVQYSGIADIEDYPCKPITYKQNSIIKKQCVPSKKPSIENVLKVISLLKIYDIKPVHNPYDIKFVVTGIIKQRVLYTALLEEQSVHSFHIEIPFCELIIVHECDWDYDLNKVRIKGYIEDVHLFNIGERELEECIIVCFTVEEDSC